MSRFFRKIRRFVEKIYVMQKGARLSFGTVVDVTSGGNPYSRGEDLPKGEAILATRFRHKNKFGEVVNRYEHLLNEKWYAEGRLTVVKMPDEDMF